MESFLQHRQIAAHVREIVSQKKQAYDQDSSTRKEKIEAPGSPPPTVRHTSSNSHDARLDKEDAFADFIVCSSKDIRVERDEEFKPPIAFVVEPADDDSDLNPRTWSHTRRLRTTVIVWLLVFVCGYASAADSSTNKRAAASQGVSTEAESLATALFLFGNAIGALASGPVSETVGRNPSYLVFMVLYLISVLITALAPNYTVFIIFRFFAGFTASPILTIYGGSLSDMYDDSERSLVWPLFATSPLLGPIIAPIPSGWLVNNMSLPYQWVNWVTLIISGAVFILALFLLPETFAPMLATWKAANLRKVTGEPRFKSQHEFDDNFAQRLKTNLSRPIIFFTKEPIVICLGFYLTLIYILVFTFLDGFTFIFHDTYNFSPGLEGSTFAAIVIGILLNTAIQPFFAQQYRHKLRAHQDTTNDPDAKLAPEIRLYPAMIAAPLLPISLFWLGWTNYASISPWSNIIAAGLFGFALIGIFVASYQYILDSYETTSASALSSITFMRYAVAGGMVIADMPMYRALGVHWTLTLLGCLAVVAMPFPFVFWRYGSAVRKRSHFAQGQQ